MKRRNTRPCKNEHMPLETRLGICFLIDPVPPPTRHILWYAVQGWALEKHVKIPKNRLTPEMHLWMPDFIRLLNDPDWPDQLRIWALIGASLHKTGHDMKTCISRCFNRPDMRPRLIHEIADRCAAQKM